MVVPFFPGGGRIELAERAVPEPGAGELLLRVGANALCGTDLHQYRDGSPVVTPGHEVAGAVAAAGPGTSTEPGTNGVVYLMGYCGRCRSCALGHTNQCAAKTGDTGFTRDGGLAPYVVVPERTFFATGDVDPAEATLLLDVMGTTRHAIERATRVRPDVETMFVNRAGPIGLGLLAMARLLLGDVRVYVADDAPFRRDLVARLGGIPLRGSDPPPERADVAFDASGRAAARQACLDALDRRGVLVCLAHGRDRTVELAVTRDLITPERAVLGSEYFRYTDLAPNLALLRRERAYLRRILTHRFPLPGLATAFEAFAAGETGKVVVEHR